MEDGKTSNSDDSNRDITGTQDVKSRCEFSFYTDVCDAMLFRLRKERQFDHRTVNSLSFAIVATSATIIMFPDLPPSAKGIVSAFNILLSIVIIMLNYELYSKDHDGRITRLSRLKARLDIDRGKKTADLDRMASLRERVKYHYVEFYQTDKNYVHEVKKYNLDDALLISHKGWRAKWAFKYFHVWELYNIIAMPIIIIGICVFAVMMNRNHLGLEVSSKNPATTLEAPTSSAKK